MSAALFTVHIFDMNKAAIVPQVACAALQAIDVLTPPRARARMPRRAEHWSQRWRIIHTHYRINPMHVVIVAHAPALDARPYAEILRAADCRIAADGGALPLLAAQILPEIMIGDLDSLDLASQATLVARGVELRRFPREKDETDFELALLLAADMGADAIDVLGALGGRWDHTLANVWLLAHPALQGRRVRLLDGDQTLFLVRDQATIDGQHGDTISLIPLTPEVRGITTSGLRYPLDDATLYASQARGVSNVLLAPPANVTISHGLLIVVQHDDGGAHQWNVAGITTEHESHDE